MLTAHLIAAVAAVASSQVSAAPAAVKRAVPDLTSFFDSLGNITDYSQLLPLIQNIPQVPAPTSMEEAVSQLQASYAANQPKGYFQAAAQVIANSFSSKDIAQDLAGYSYENNAANLNLHEPDDTIYPHRSPGDAPYSQSEEFLRRQIYIPPTFTYGKKPPVILVPGTGARGGNNFASNIIHLLTGNDWADPVWINPDGFMLANTQLNAEYVAYAINYISGISGNRKVALIGWSQASLDTQRALKYWPSTQWSASKFIAVSGDFHGTQLAYVLDGFNTIPNPPAVLQQDYSTSSYVSQLRQNGGDSAYIPTTTIYSGFFDEIVEPQQGKGASSYLLDARNVGVTNYEVQSTCPPGSPGAGFFTHESMLIHPLTFALIQDALTHDGPAETSRVNLASVCSQYLPPGRSFEDYLATESSITIALLEIILYPYKTTQQPGLFNYVHAKRYQ